MTPEMLDQVMVILGALITLFVGFIGQQSRKRWGIELSARSRETLQSALHTGALMAWARFSDQVVSPSREDMIAIVLNHMKGDGAGESIKKLQTSDTTLRSLAEAKLMEVGNQLQFANMPTEPKRGAS